MSSPLILLLVIHNHQPVGNPEEVLESAYQQAYLPFFQVLERYPEIKLTMHFSGPLLKWLTARHPEFIERLAGQVGSGQVELLSGGFYEPILAAIPDEDKKGQIEMLSRYLEGLFGCRPRGLWLTERVWEPSLPRPLAEAGIEYTIVDSDHFLKSGFTEEELSGYYITEEAGHALKLFPGRERLRYLIPFKPAQEVVDYLKGQSARVVVYADDGEKFGLWPGTYGWVYEQGWLNDFFSLLTENKPSLPTMTLSEFADANPPSARVYLGTATYPEMVPWTLPPGAALELEALRHKEEVRPFLLGGLWRNFLTKYEEANDLHKRMGRVSAKLNQLKLQGQPVPQAAFDALYQGQGNDPYWHGIFGGLYLPHLRAAAYAHLIQAEKEADALRHSFSEVPTLSGDEPTSDFFELEVKDINADGWPEVQASWPALAATFAPAKGGCLYELDYKPGSVNLINTLTRRREAYHARLKEEATRTALASIHDLAILTDVGIAPVPEEIPQDSYRRACFQDRFLGPEVDLASFSQGSFIELGDFLAAPYRVVALSPIGVPNPTFLGIGMPAQNTVRAGPVPAPGQKEKFLILERQGYLLVKGRACPLTVKKLFRFQPYGLKAEYSLIPQVPYQLKAIFAVEFNIGLEAGQAPDRYYLINGKKPAPPHLASQGITEKVTRVALIDQYRRISVTLHFAPPCQLWRFPVETLSRSEKGLERLYQGSCLLARFPVKVGATRRVAPTGGQPWQMTVVLEVGGVP